MSDGGIGGSVPSPAAAGAADLGSLRALVDGRHLEVAARRRCRQAFGDHPARLVVLDDFLVPDVAERLRSFLRDEAVFEPQYGVYDVDDAVDRATWDEAPAGRRFFRFRRLTATRPGCEMSTNALTYLSFRTQFRQPPLRRLFEELTGLDLDGSDDVGSHAMEPGDFLRPHSDHNRNRLLAIVLYLNDRWHPSHGGVLQVQVRGGDRFEVVPAFNRLVAFDVTADTDHEVAPIASDAPEPRLTIGGWYHHPAR